MLHCPCSVRLAELNCPWQELASKSIGLTNVSQTRRTGLCHQFILLWAWQDALEADSKSCAKLGQVEKEGTRVQLSSMSFGIRNFLFKTSFLPI